MTLSARRPVYRRARLERLLHPQSIAIVRASQRLPLLFHCSADRDRTGIGAALLLTAFGVPREIVIADHLATNRVCKRDARCRRARPTISASPAWRAPAGHGSLDALLENGLDPAPLARLRATLLE